MNGRREASRWSGSPILPYGFGDRRMRVRTGMRSIPCAATPWSMVRVHDIAIACTRLGISTPYHGSYHVRCLFEGVPVLVGCTLYTRPRPRCLFTGCLFTDRGSGNQRSFLRERRTAGTGPRPGCALLLRHKLLAGFAYARSKTAGAGGAKMDHRQNDQF